MGRACMCVCGGETGAIAIASVETSGVVHHAVALQGSLVIMRTKVGLNNLSATHV